MIGFKGAAERIDEHDIKSAVRDLPTTPRAEFMAEHGERVDRLGIPIFTITGATRITEVPYFQMQGVRTLNEHDPDNDMQLTQEHGPDELPDLDAPGDD